MIEQFLPYFSLLEKVVLFLVLFAFVMQFYYYSGVFGRVAYYSKKKRSFSTLQQPVSIIICARNEQVALRENLKRLLEQNYPEYEVIVVNDCSEDDSEVVLASMQEQYPHLIFRTIVKDEIFKHNKKMALGVGIKAARYDLLLFTDADCCPANENWLDGMQRHFTEKISIVLGYTRLTNNARWIRADRFMHALHYLGKALKHKPYMGVGSNLGYRKNLFFDNKGFDMRIIGNLREDRVFINKVATSDNTDVAISPDEITVSALHITPGRWRRERHEELRSFTLCSKGSRYPELAEVLYRLLFYAGLAVAIVLFFSELIVLLALGGVFLLRMFIQLTIFFKAQRHLGDKGLPFMLLLWDLVFPFVYISMIFTSKIRRKKNLHRGLWN
jgi:glycosyltransferase involved in cell wall biosynthesis